MPIKCLVRVATAAILLGLATLPAGAQPSEADIAAAIQQGMSNKNRMAAVRLDGDGGFSATRYAPFVVVAMGPLNRVQDAAATAAKEYRPFTREDVTPEMLADEIVIAASPKTPSSVSATPYRADRIVIQTRTKPPVTFQPTRMTPMPVEWANGFGAKVSSQGIEAVFLAADVPADELEVVIVTPFPRETRLLVKQSQRQKIR